MSVPCVPCSACCVLCALRREMGRCALADKQQQTEEGELLTDHKGAGEVVNIAMSGPICSSCNSSIDDIVLNAFGMQWHPHHLGCNVCGKDFSDGSRCEEGPDGFAYCSSHFVEQFAPKCGGCGLPILGTVVNALEKAWHPEHFACATCKQPLSNSFFHGEDMIPYCEKHYYASMNLLCASCDKPIVTGKLVSMGTKRYHPEHFSCSFCKKNLAGAGYKKQNEKPYCNSCFVKLYG